MIGEERARVVERDKEERDEERVRMAKRDKEERDEERARAAKRNKEEREEERKHQKIEGGKQIRVYVNAKAIDNKLLPIQLVVNSHESILRVNDDRKRRNDHI